MSTGAPGGREADRSGVAPDEERQERVCPTCGVRLSAYNPGPYCWRHAMGFPWRGPSAKPRFER